MPDRSARPKVRLFFPQSDADAIRDHLTGLDRERAQPWLDQLWLRTRIDERRWFEERANSILAQLDPPPLVAERDLLVVIPCAGRKLNRAAPARDLYTGPLFRSALAAAEAIGDHIVILSALHGIVELHRVLDPYDLRVGDPGTVSPERVRDQLADYQGARIIALLPQAYDQLLTTATGEVHTNPLRGSRGIGEQRARLARLAGERLVRAA